MNNTPPIISSMFTASKNSNKTILNYFSSDIATGLKRVLTQAYPLFKNNKFVGALIEELDVDTTFNNSIIP
jgi:hypothetical protein